MNEHPEMDALVSAARSVRAHAYAPYSRYAVGAALRDEHGRVHVGVNVENASYGATICAERSALAALISSGARQWTALAVVTGDEARPCGMCRQALAEFVAPEALVACVADPSGTTQVITFVSLIPEWFTSDPSRFPQLLV